MLVCRPLEAVAAHVFTTRGFLLGVTRTGDLPWEQVRLAIGASQLVRLHQVHGRTAINADRLSCAPLHDADILLTSDCERAIAVQAADCVPLLIADGRLGVVAAAHAGWRGLALGVPGATVDALVTTFGSRPGDLVAAIGPSIGSCCYEVGPDVRAAFASGGFDEEQLARWFFPAPQPTPGNRSMEGLPAVPREGHGYFDGWASATEQLCVAGLAAERIFGARLCTASHPEIFCSYRRERAHAGRIAGAIVPRRRD